jgi:NUDIX domain
LQVISFGLVANLLHVFSGLTRINVLVEAPPTNEQTERQFFIFEQTKYALEGRMSKAVIGGIIEPGENAEHAARREVQEEMGLVCKEMKFLGRYRTDGKS